jgi:DNA-binding response OmpR family regulator
LILSALDSPGLVAAALDAGADDYLIKPVASSVLVAHIHNLVRRTRINPGPKGIAAAVSV